MPASRATCACTGSHNIIRAVLAAAGDRQPGGDVIPAPFAYQRARSVEEAPTSLPDDGEDAKLLAGGIPAPADAPAPLPP